MTAKWPRYRRAASAPAGYPGGAAVPLPPVAPAGGVVPGPAALYAGVYSGAPAGAAAGSASANDGTVAVLDEPVPANASLAEVAKSAALKAERVAIEETLHKVHWNRRKAAQQLGVSYKTLLNKIKECGISRK